MSKTGVVFDNGSCFSKVGYGGSGVPSKIFPTVVGRERDGQNIYVGDEAISMHLQKKCQRKYPVEHGIVTNWDDMQRVWEHSYFEQLKIEPSEHPIVCLEALIGPKANRERTTQIMFETFNVPQFYSAYQGVLPLYACGRTTGTTLECGGSVTYCTPVYESYQLPHALNRLDIGGRNIDAFMLKKLYEKGYSFKSTVGNTISQDIKETKGFTALKYPQNKAELKKARDSYELPDGQILSLDFETCAASEVFFRPVLEGTETAGIISCLNTTIMKSDVDIRHTLYKNIVLSGGSTLFPGMQERIKKDLKREAGNMYNPDIVAVPHRKYLAWQGGSVLSSLSTFQQKYIDKTEYDASGPGIVHRKCF